MITFIMGHMNELLPYKILDIEASSARTYI